MNLARLPATQSPGTRTPDRSYTGGCAAMPGNPSTDAPPAPRLIPQRYEPFVAFTELTPHPANPNSGDVGLVAELLVANGYAGAILAQESTGLIIDGEHRRAAAMAEGMTGGPVLYLDVTDDERDRLLASINESTRRGYNDEGALIRLLEGLAATPRGLAGTAYTGEDLDDLIARMNMPPLPGDGDGDGDGAGGASPRSLADRFRVPPFSVLDARQGYWQDRKRAWLALGIRSEQGRPHNLLKMSDTVLDAQQGKGRMRDSGYDQASLSTPRTAMLGNPRYARGGGDRPNA